ncbi:MAG: phosphate/phosphite/phosphonate ABC transporter substrate-binding protein [Chloroflexi bacterium]|nr:phosphate/phosphite/phosphonate ABC transporter substrate-binding protein [Chloroflexota bacterium]
MRPPCLPLLYIALILIAAVSCRPSVETPGPQYAATPVRLNVSTYRFAVYPLYNPTKLFQVYQPLIDYLNKNLGNAQFTLEASRDYAAFEDKYGKREPDFLLPNAWQTLQAIQSGYHVIATAGEPSDFKGIFIVRKDSTIKQPADLKGKAISYPSATAFAACIMPQYWLYQNHIDIKRDIENHYVGSQESSIMNVYLKLTAVGATWPPPWRAFQVDHPQQANELKVLWETESLINNSVMARDDVPTDVQERIQTLLAGLDKTQEGKAILAGMETARFILAKDKDYDVVQVYVSRFEKDVRKVNEP